MKSWLVGVLLCLLAQPAIAGTADRGGEILHYAVRLTVDIPNKSIRGRETLDVEAKGPLLQLDAGALVIDSVHIAGKPVAWRKDGTSLLITLPNPVARQRITINYHGAPKFGLEFHPERREAYTIFSTSQWMPSIDAPDARATLALTILAATGLEVVASGRSRGSSAAGKSMRAHRWTIDTPRPGFLYAFAIGPYQRLMLDAKQPELTVFSINPDRAVLEKAFSGTRAILDFMQNKAGPPYPHPSYSQVLVADTIGQEAEGMALLSVDYAAALASGDDDETLIAHEIAHQWWGASLTCKSWSHFWLNEGFATFMSAAWIEQRNGRTAYLARVDAWRAQIAALKNEGQDHPLVFQTWKPTSRNRTIAYRKGALFLHTLREMLGDEAFWRGIRSYTRDNAGRAVVTADFRHAMEQTSGRDLGALFKEWTGDGSAVSTRSDANGHHIRENGPSALEHIE